MKSGFVTGGKDSEVVAACGGASDLPQFRFASRHGVYGARACACHVVSQTLRTEGREVKARKATESAVVGCQRWLYFP